MASCPSSAPSPVISLAKADLSAGFLTWGRCTTGSLKAGLTLIFPCEALSTRPEDPQQTFIYLPTYADCLPYLTHTLKAILAMLPLKRTPKLHTHRRHPRCCVCHCSGTKALCKVPSSRSDTFMPFKISRRDCTSALDMGTKRSPLFMLVSEAGP